jgi:endonuclease YncB( thermonuclease family)
MPKNLPRLSRASIRRAAALLLAALVALILARLAGPKGRPAPGARSAKSEHCLVTHVYDGDTIEADGCRKVRLIGVDALDGYEQERTRGQAEDLVSRPGNIY